MYPFRAWPSPTRRVRTTAASPRPVGRLLLLVFFAAVAAACGRGGGSGADQASLGPTVLSTGGDEISLSGEVTATYGTRVFAVGSGAERVIVVARSPVAVVVGDEVEATGAPRTFARRELESELGVDLGSAVDGLEDSRCLVATVTRIR